MSEHEPLTDRVEAALRQVRDPQADLSVFEAGFVENIAVDDGDVTIEADISSLESETSSQVVEAMLRAVDDVDGVSGVHVERTTPSSEERASVQSFDHVIAVASAKGGVGKSTTATHLACGLAADNDVALFDADIHGPNVPELLDVSGPVHSSEEGDPLPVAVDGMDVMSVGPVESGAPLAWRNDDVLVIDL